jgi:hypothetical protein
MRFAGLEICDRNVGRMIFALKYLFGLITGTQGDEEEKMCGVLESVV